MYLWLKTHGVKAVSVKNGKRNGSSRSGTKGTNGLLNPKTKGVRHSSGYSSDLGKISTRNKANVVNNEGN